MTKKRRIAIFKFNGGAGALLCSKCKVIIKTGKDFDEQEIKAIKGYITLPPALCESCDKTFKRKSQWTKVNKRK